MPGMQRLIAAGLVLGVAAVAVTATPPIMPAKAPATATAPATEPALPPTLLKLINALSSPDCSVREETTYTLLRLPSSQLSNIEMALARSTDDEEAMRLTRIALHLYLKQQTAMDGQAALLGIALNMEPVRLGKDNSELSMSVAVTETQPGFPAAEMLRPGDRLVAVEGRPFAPDTTLESFRQMINSQKPGTALTFTVFRSGRKIEASVRLAGAPEAGVAAISELVDKRNKATALYLQEHQAKTQLPMLLETKDDQASELPKATEDGFIIRVLK